MRQLSALLSALLLTQALAFGQTPAGTDKQTPARPAPTQAPAPAQQQAPARPLDLSDYGVHFALEPRLVVVMAALDAAGFDPKDQNAFRLRLRGDQAGLDANLRDRLSRFYELNKLKDPKATPAEQAARYVSLALALTPPPALEAPPRSEDLFAGVLDVLDFAPLVREFWGKSGIEGRLPAYLAAYRAEADRLRRPTAEMVRGVLNYLHTRPATTAVERVAAPAQPGDKKKKEKDARPVIVTREHERRFLVVPDLLAAPGAINFRIVGDDYYVIVPAGANPASSEVRRAYLQYVIDPVVLRYNREIALKRADIRALLDERAKALPAGAELPDVFTAVARSLVAATDARMNAAARTRAATEEARRRLQAAKESERPAIAKEAEAERARIEEELVAELAEAYERGAVLAFYFADQLREQEAAGFDFSSFFADLINGVDVAREKRRPAEYAAARERVLAARREAARETASRRAAESSDDPRLAALNKNLAEVNELLRARNYTAAQERLAVMQREHQGEPRIFFALAQAASMSARDAFDENLRDERLGRALANYRFAVNSASPESDAALISRAHTAAGLILAFLERNDEAVKEFEAAAKLGDVPGGAYKDAVEQLKKLRP